MCHTIGSVLLTKRWVSGSDNLGLITGKKDDRRQIITYPVADRYSTTNVNTGEIPSGKLPVIEKGREKSRALCVSY
ncbi:unnamed protein product, partial [Nesidiocoris tenuis]